MNYEKVTLVKRADRNTQWEGWPRMPMKLAVWATFIAALVLPLTPINVRAQESTLKPAPKVLTAAEIAEKLKYSVFTIQTDNGTGTGFVLGDHFGLLTCWHVVNGAKKISADIPGKPETDVSQVLTYSSDVDCALLDLHYSIGKTTTIGRSSALKVGDRLYVLGSPRGLGQTLTEGILSGRRHSGGREYLQLSAAISPGSSGSPVLNDRGEIVGLVSFMLKDSQQLNFAVGIDSVLKELKGGVPIANIVATDAPIKRTDAKPASNFPKQFGAKESLTGVGKVAVVVEDLPSSAVEFGISRDAITTDVELKLRSHGIEIAGDKDIAPYLYVFISSLKHSSTGQLVYNVSVSFKQVVRLDRDSDVGTVAATWERKTGGYVGPAVAVQTIRENVGDFVNEFVNDYLTVNPKPTATVAPTNRIITATPAPER